MQLNKRQHLLLRWTMGSLFTAILAGLIVVLLSRRKDPAYTAPGETTGEITSVLRREADTGMATIRFEETAEAAGIRFQHFPAVRGSLLPEDMGSGCAWGDYDGDGDPDLFLVNFAGPVTAAAEESAGRCALYRNNGDGTFSDVSMASGLDAALFGMGVAWGDYDNDRDLDLAVTCFGPNRLYRNEGDGTFTDVSAAAGIADERFGAGLSWGDYDADGDLDLYVCNYVDFTLGKGGATAVARQYGSEVPFTINPSSYPPQSNCLFRNNGDGTFTDVAREAGVSDPGGRGLAVVWADLDGDGWIDLYVANDVSSNAVFSNRGDGTFEDIGAESLAADYRGAMGIATGDPDGDGDQDLYITHWLAQENAFFVNHSSELAPRSGEDLPLGLIFMDLADEWGLGQITIDMVGWSTSFGDFDNDGLLDLWVCNGSTLESPEDHTKLVKQRPFLFRQVPEKGFYEVGKESSPVFGTPILARGGSQADFDGDGLLDLCIMTHGGSPLLLRNRSATENHWLAVRLIQSRENTRALGAKVTVKSGDTVQTAQIGAGGPYLSQNDTDLHFGIGQDMKIDELEIVWPDGERESHTDIEADRFAIYEHTAHYPRKPTNGLRRGGKAPLAASVAD